MESSLNLEEKQLPTQTKEVLLLLKVMMLTVMLAQVPHLTIQDGTTILMKLTRFSELDELLEMLLST
jgi:hypothetical protein